MGKMVKIGDRFTISLVKVIIAHIEGAFVEDYLGFARNMRENRRDENIRVRDKHRRSRNFRRRPWNGTGRSVPLKI